jgi:hypothetical protein
MLSPVAATCQLIENTLAQSPAYSRIDERLYVVKQGSTFVMINVLPWGSDRAVVRCVAQLVRGVKLQPELTKKLLEMNAILRFGAFAYVPEGKVIIFLHSILGGRTLDPEELVATVRDVALVADEYDNRIAAKFGGQTMAELLEESVLTHLKAGKHGHEHWEN